MGLDQRKKEGVHHTAIVVRHAVIQQREINVIGSRQCRCG